MLITRFARCATFVALAGLAQGQVFRYALTPDLGTDRVSIVDVDALLEIANIPTGGSRPIAVVTSPNGRSAYVLHSSMNGGSADVAIIDLIALTSVGRLPGLVPSGHEMQISPSGRWLVISSEEEARLYRYDLANLTAPALTLALAPGASSVGSVEIAIAGDSLSVFSTVGSLGLISRVDLLTMQQSAFVPAGNLGAELTQDLQVQPLQGVAGQYVACWTRNSPSVSFNTWNTSTGQVSSVSPVISGRGYQIALDSSNGLAGIVGDFVFPTGAYTGGVLLLDITTLSLQTNIASTGYNSPVREVHFSQGRFYGLKRGSGLLEFDPATSSVTAEYIASTVPWEASRSALTLDGTRHVFTAFTTPTSSHLVIVDPTSNLLLADVLLSGSEPQTVAIAECSGGAGLDHCNGDGGDQLGCTACPCTNQALAGTTGGCLNSTLNPAVLISSGSHAVSLPSQSNDDLRFALQGVPPTSFCILTSGDSLTPDDTTSPCFGTSSGTQAAFLDGLLCVSTNTRRHGGRRANAFGEVGTSNMPWGGEGNPAVGLALSNGGFSAGQTRHFQAIFRDDPTLVCLQGLNTSQAVEVTFCP